MHDLEIRITCWLDDWGPRIVCASEGCMLVAKRATEQALGEWRPRNRADAKQLDPGMSFVSISSKVRTLHVGNISFSSSR